MARSKPSSVSTVPNARIIDFECAELRRVPFQDSLYLWVRGSLPGPGLEARLAPRHHHARPEYWDIEVAAVADARPGAKDAANAQQLHFERSVPLTGITGFRGISVIGANQVKRIEISGESL